MEIDEPGIVGVPVPCHDITAAAGTLSGASVDCKRPDGAPEISPARGLIKSYYEIILAWKAENAGEKAD
jgi:hypothetical protein